MPNIEEGALSASFAYGRNSLFKYFYAYPSSSGIKLFWELFPVLSPSEQPFAFSIYRASGVPPVEDFTLINTVIDDWTYTDTSYTEHSKRYNISYKLVLRTKTTEYNSEIISILGNIQQHNKNYIKAILRRAHISRRSVQPYRSLFLKRRHFGIKCSCVDPITEEITKTDCQSCYGTGILGGYWKTSVPVVLITSSPLSNTIMHDTSQNVGSVSPGIMRVKVAYPMIIDQYDALIHLSTGNRFYITGVQVSAEVEGFPIVYDLEIRLAERKDVLYQYPVTV